MIRAIALRGTSFIVLWWILAEGSPDGWLLGGIAAVLATWTSLRLWSTAPVPVRLAGWYGFLRFFLWHSIRSGIQVAGMALRGRAALRPALIRLAVTLPPGGARVLLVVALGLMPGTLGVDLDDAGLRLHVLDVRLPVAAETRALETAIAGLFGLSS
jgi:multicomponent Na+:H+ antiporter subunit E